MFYIDDALLQFSKISELQKADSHNVECLRRCLKTVERYAIAGAGSHTWGNISDPKKEQARLTQLFLGLFTNHFSSHELQPEDDKDKKYFKEHLIVPRQRKTDALTLWVAKKFVPFYHALFKAHQHQPNSQDQPNSNGFDPEAGEKKTSIRSSSWTGMSASKTWASWSSRSVAKPSRESTPPCKEIQDTLTRYSREWMVRITSIITTVVACLLPTVAITVLTKLHTMGETLGAIALFTALFAIGLSFLTGESTRVEIFTATAA
jgi:hypothetical protein